MVKKFKWGIKMLWKKVAIVVLMVVTIALMQFAKAQEINPEIIKIGGRIGLSLGRLSVKGLPDGVKQNFGIGIEGGVALGVTSSDILEVEAGIGVSQRRGVYSNNGVRKITVKLNYLNAPILAKVRFRSTGIVKPYLLFGVEPSIWLSGEIKYEFEAVDWDMVKIMSISGAVVSSDIGIDLGSGVEFNLGRIVPFFDIKYSLGLFKINETAIYRTEEIKLRTLLIAVGVKHTLDLMK